MASARIGRPCRASPVLSGWDIALVEMVDGRKSADAPARPDDVTPGQGRRRSASSYRPPVVWVVPTEAGRLKPRQRLPEVRLRGLVAVGCAAPGSFRRCREDWATDRAGAA